MALLMFSSKTQTQTVTV